MKIIGLTGGIGSGKSVVAKFFDLCNIPVYYTDIEAKRIMAESVFIRERLSEKFGSHLYRNGKLDKNVLASLIFNQEENLQFVNSLIHPEVQKDFIGWTKQFNNLPFVVLESAILIESGFNTFTDIVVSVSAPLEKKINRIKKRDQTTRELILSRMQNQLTEEERNPYADFIILNDDKEALLPQIENLIKRLN
jgi:dephospho-CoA kinase